MNSPSFRQVSRGEIPALHAWRKLVLGVLAFLTVLIGAKAGTWTPLAHTAPSSVGLMLLLPDGTVMAHHDNSSAWYRLKPDSQGHYINGTWTTLASMHDTRLYYSAQILVDGRVFVAGGEYGTGARTGETYDPLTNLWRMAPPTTQNFYDSNSEILPDGRILVAPVSPSPSLSTIIYNPVTNAWTTGPTLHGSQDESAWVKLPDDSILTIDIASTYAERYIPSLNQWIADATVPVALYDPYGSEMGGGFLLPNGKVFFLGSTGRTAIYTPSGTTANGSWIIGPDIPGAQGTPDAPAAMMFNGKILCAVSPVPTSANHFPSPTAFYEFDYTTNTFTSVSAPTGATLNHPSYYGTMLCLPDGTVLYADFASQIYSYQPDGTPIPSGKPAINPTGLTPITQNADGSYHLTGTQLNGISEGTCYGDDNQNATNYPIVRLTSGATVYNARTYNWSRTGVMTGATSVSTEFALPQGLPAGTYSVTAIANGISSDPVTLTVAPIVVTLPTSLTEGAAPVSGTVTLPTAPASDTVVSLGSTDTSRATVPASVTVLAGQTSATFQVSAVEDALLTGAKAVGISASATGYDSGLNYITILDNETAILTMTPTATQTSTGVYGGPFSPTSFNYTVANSGNTSLNWTLTHTASWVTLSASSGTLAGGANTTVTATINSNANIQAVGTLTDTITARNTTTGDGNTTRAVNLTVTGSPSMSVTAGNFSSSGNVGGPFTPASTPYTITNTGNAPMNWTAAKTATWLTLSSASGTLAPGANVIVTASINTATANTLTAATYNDTITFTNTSNSVGNTTRAATLTVNPLVAVLSVSPAGGLTSTGTYAGPFTPSSQTFTVTNTGNTSMNWTASKTVNWLDLSATSGTLGAGANTTVTATINATAASLTPGSYSDTVSFTNTSGGSGNTTRPVSLTVTGSPILSVTPAGNLAASGNFAGPFAPSSASYNLTNTGNAPLNWTVTKTASWLSLTSGAGTLGVGGSTIVTANINATANTLDPGTLLDTMAFTNVNNGSGNTTRAASLTIVLPAPTMSAKPPITGGTSSLSTWSTVTGAGQYEAQYANNAAFTSPVSSGALSSATYNFTGLSDGVTYYYRARAIRNSTQTYFSAWSPAVSSKQDSQPPAVTLTTNPSTLQSSLTLAGTASDANGVQSVTVAGGAAQTSDSYAHWTRTISGLAVGANTVTVIASDSASPPNVTTTNYTITRLADSDGTGLPDSWKDSHGLTGADRLASADPDHDGIPNLIEYALNLDPNATDATGLPTSTTAVNPADNKAYLTYTYNRIIGGGGLQYMVEVSPTLTPWSPIAGATEQVSSPSPNADGVTEAVTMRILPTLDAHVTRFARLHIITQ